MDGGGGAQRPVWGGNELKKTGARSARARTRGQNPLVTNNRRNHLPKLNHKLDFNASDFFQWKRKF